MNFTKSLVLSLAVGGAAALGLSSCAGTPKQPFALLEGRAFHTYGKAQPSSVKHYSRPTVGLALGGGGLRGLAHIGVLQALEEAGIKPDVVVGTSAGALVGATFASGKSSDEIMSLARELKILSLVDFTLSSSGIMRGDNIAQWLDEAVGGVPIESFPTKFAAVATDLERGVPIILERGSAGNAVRASAAVPGVNVPVPYRDSHQLDVPYLDGYLVDGGVSSLIPVRTARALGADIVIAVDIYCHGVGKPGNSAAAVVSQTIHTQSCLIASPEFAEADIRISPVAAVPGMSDKEEQQRVIQAGYEAARAVLARSDLTALSESVGFGRFAENGRE